MKSHAATVARRSRATKSQVWHGTKVKVPCSLDECRRGAHLPSVSHWARSWINHWSLWRMTSVTPVCGYLPSRRTSSPFDRGQFILLGDRGTCVNNLPKVVIWKRNGRESNRDPLSRASNVITITPPDHTVICCEICSPDLRPFFIHWLTMLLSLRRLPRCHYPHDTMSSCETDEWICCVSRHDFGDLNNAFMIEVFVDHVLYSFRIFKFVFFVNCYYVANINFVNLLNDFFLGARKSMFVVFCFVCMRVNNKTLLLLLDRFG